ncbi:hypothetical protein J2Z21_001272 [Streptomyces griseochromogenes]|uniref:Uncharacterized protein n=1 Tax=Streptomyces griseochromogenes TaxID=68214 RepID=A0ABS4LLS7_9ACTN|nr:hypothetical protein [Streptomyces griseochromogenes]
MRDRGPRPPKARTLVVRASAGGPKNSLDQLTALVKTRLKRMRYRPCLHARAGRNSHRTRRRLGPTG